VDDCLESQRCLNTPGGYKCIRTQTCGTGYAMDSQSEQCVGGFGFLGFGFSPCGKFAVFFLCDCGLQLKSYFLLIFKVKQSRKHMKIKKLNIKNH
jgi:hypothetical protein